MQFMSGCFQTNRNLSSWFVTLSAFCFKLTLDLLVLCRQTFALAMHIRLRCATTPFVIALWQSELLALATLKINSQPPIHPQLLKTVAYLVSMSRWLIPTKWFFPGEVIILSATVLFPGNLTVLEGGVIRLNEPNSTLYVNGCVSLNGGTVEFDIGLVSNNQSTNFTVVQSGGSCLTGGLTAAVVINSLDPCVTYNSEISSTPQQLSVLFSPQRVQTTECSPSAPNELTQPPVFPVMEVAVGVTVGVVGLAAVIVVVVIVKVKSCKEKVAPYRDTEM